mmetsp:Transcript_26402/g.29210  ORF Transcript_26402/g.29210 Transcript_26402/m.29210 type:complete len:101 (+) Transcript_26402:153-455(+)
MMNLLPRTFELCNEESTEMCKDQAVTHSGSPSSSLTVDNCEKYPNEFDIVNSTTEIKLHHQLQLHDDILDELAHEVEQDGSEWENTLWVWDPKAENLPFD